MSEGPIIFPSPKTQLKRRKCYKNADKIEMLKRAKEIGNRAAGKEYDVDEANLRYWRKREGDFLPHTKNKRCKRTYKGKWDDLEMELVEWIKDRRQQQFRVLGTVLQAQAKLIAQRRGIAEFTGSNGWLSRFKIRNGLATRFTTSVGQPLPIDHLEKISNFQAFCKSRIHTFKLQNENIVNMDEVPCSFDMPGSRTMDFKGASHIGLKTTGAERSNFTLVFGVSASGEKLAPMIIFKRKTLPKEAFPSGIHVRVNEKGWVNSDVMIDWINTCWKGRPGTFFSKPKKEDCLLIYDSFKGHLTDEVKKCVAKHAHLAVIPGGLTKFLQPLDLSVNFSFKSHIRKLWDAWMMEAGNVELTKGGNRKRPSYAMVCEFVVKAWSSVEPNTIRNGFRKAGLVKYDEERELRLESLSLDGDDNESSSDLQFEDEDPDDFLNLDTEQENYLLQED